MVYGQRSVAGWQLRAIRRSYHLFRLGRRWRDRPCGHCGTGGKRYGLYRRRKLRRLRPSEQLSHWQQRHLRLRYPRLLEEWQKKTRGHSSGSFALHSPLIVASMTESSLSSSPSSRVSTRLRTELFSALLPVCIYSSTEISNIVIS